MASSILPLPAAVIAQIRSSITITSLNDVVLELFKNSLDASAQKVEITVDFVRGGCTIEDDGVGIPPVEFAEDGGLGKLYHTSKYQSSTLTHGTHGTHGRFIASLVALAIVSITSHHHKHHSHNTIDMYKSEVITRQTPSTDQHRITISNHGTRVIVRNLFGSMPVRVKQRGIMGTTVGISKQWDGLIKSVISLILAWDRPVSVVVRDTTNNQRFRIRGDPNAATWRKGTIGSVCSILTQASLISAPTRSSWVPILASTSTVRITGVVSTDPAPAKHVQFLSLGVRPLPSSCGYGELYEEINRLFTDSSFGNEELIDSINPKTESRGYTTKQLKGMGKGVDRWPRFCLNIELCSDSTIRAHEVKELLSGGYSSILNSISDLLVATITGFLQQYNFHPRKARKHNAKVSVIDPSPKVGPVVQENPGTLFSTWTRTKSGAPPASEPKHNRSDNITLERASTVPLVSLQESPGPHSASVSQHIVQRKILDKSGKVIQQPFKDVERCPSRSPSRSVESKTHNVELQKSSGDTADVGDDIVNWTDPTTKVSYRVNSGTGMIVNEQKAPKRLSAALNGDFNTGLAFRKKLKTAEDNEHPQEPEWLCNFLKNWKNPIYNPSERPIPRVDFELGLGMHNLLNDHDYHCSQLDMSKAFESLDTNGVGRLSKPGLKQAEVIAQVDKKFILAKIPWGSPIGMDDQGNETNGFLVLIDQHAADERCRIETLMSSFCKPSNASDLPISVSGCVPGILTMRLEKSINFEVSSKERQLLEKHLQHFANWGIMYDLLSTAESSKATARVVVRALPPGIAERCRTDSKILIELIRSEVWARDGSGLEARTRSPFDDEIGQDSIEAEKHGWLRKIHDCPKGLVDMLNSRACRSAIMFNDHLSLEQCQTLVSRLADCAFPFQCAHGRPSMVPLLDMQGLRQGDNLSSEQTIISGNEFVNSFRKWKEAM